jgi:peptidyl-prolyl cis-trans isomerase SurA
MTFLNRFPAPFNRLLLPALLCTIAAHLAFGTVSLAQTSVRVLVNEQPVTTFDVQNRSKMLALFSRGTKGEKDALEQLVDERLMVQEAKRVGMLVGDAEVDEEFADRAKQVKLSTEQFSQALRQNGVDPKTFKDFLRANLSWAKIVRARFRSSGDVSEQEIASELTSRTFEGPLEQVYEYLLQPIVFVVPAKAGDGVAAQQESQANAFRSNFQGCGQSLQQAGGIKGVVVKPTVRREQRDLTGAIKEELEALDVGGITKPQRVEDGVQLIAVCEKRVISGQNEATEEVRKELTSERGKMLARRYLRDLRADAVIEYR